MQIRGEGKCSNFIDNANKLLKEFTNLLIFLHHYNVFNCY
jgi:hypothetical protein